MKQIPRMAGWRWGASLLLIGTLLGAAAPGVAAEDVPVSPVTAQWQPHEYHFQHMGFTSRYSCDGLADALKRLLLAAGARPDVIVSPGTCASGIGRPDRFASARMVFNVLSPIATTPSDDGAVQGVWKSVTIDSRTPFGLEMGDCELVEQFRDQVLKPMFPVRGLNDNITCIPHQASGSHFRLQFEVLVPVLVPVLDQKGVPVPAPTTAGQWYAYPLQGQSAERLAADRAACEAAIGTAKSETLRHEALGRCLAERGYSVR